jgi:hypothetical protein
MTQNTRGYFLFLCLALCFVLIIILVVLSSLAPILQLRFVPYQFFLIGICVGALLVATLGLAADREEWTHYHLYFFTVLISVFLLIVVNSVVFGALGGEQFVRRLVEIFWIVFSSPS